MKITIGGLKRVIREAINEEDELDEMAFAGVYPGEYDRSKRKPGGLKKKALEKNRAALAAFHASEKYRQQAEYVFRLFGSDVYVLPVETETEMGGRRAYFYPPEQGLELITKVLGIGKEKGPEGSFDVQDMKEKLKKGAILIVSLSTSISPGSTPTPWMIFHAMFDGVPHKSFETQRQQLSDMVNELHGLEGGKMYSHFTMKSGRDNNIDDPDNLVAEIMTQEVVDARGFNVKLSEDNEEVNALLQRMVETVKSWGLRELMERNMRGRVVLAHVYNILS